MGHYTDPPEDNLLGLTDRHLLDEAEAEGVIRAENFLYDLPEETDFTVALLLDLHRAAFGRVYEWAGQYRRSNPNVGSFLPPPFQQVPTLLYQFADEVQHRQRLVGTQAELAALLAYAHHRFVAIHPFTNGNGRTAQPAHQFPGLSPRLPGTGLVPPRRRHRPRSVPDRHKSRKLRRLPGVGAAN